MEIEIQLELLSRSGIKKVSLVDDVVFSGDFLLRVIKLLESRGITVSAVYAGIAIGQGMEKVVKAGYPFEYVLLFPDVIDEVCERDFFPGVPLSGRTLRGSQNVGIPYLLPFGLMNKWSSVPVNCHQIVSQKCIGLTVELFDEIGIASGRSVLCSDLDRGVPGIVSSSVPFAAELRRFLD